MIASRGLVVNPKHIGLVNKRKEFLNLILCGICATSSSSSLKKLFKSFPVYIIEFIRRVCCFFNQGNRATRLKEIQLQAGIKDPNTVLSYVSVRWESLLHCSERALNLWRYIKICVDESDSILKQEISDPEYELYVYLLYVLLHKLTGYIVYFQNSDLLFDKVMDKIKGAYILFTRMLLKPKH